MQFFMYCPNRNGSPELFAQVLGDDEAYVVGVTKRGYAVAISRKETHQLPKFEQSPCKQATNWFEFAMELKVDGTWIEVDEVTYKTHLFVP